MQLVCGRGYEVAGMLTPREPIVHVKAEKFGKVDNMEECAYA